MMWEKVIWVKADRPRGIPENDRVEGGPEDHVIK